MLPSLPQFSRSDPLAQSVQHLLSMLGAEEIQLISDSNNDVFKFRLGRVWLVFKKMNDAGIHLNTSLMIERLGRERGLLIPRTLVVDPMLHSYPSTFMVQEYIGGVCLADVLKDKPDLVPSFIDLACDTIEVCKLIPPPEPLTYGYLKADQDQQPSLSIFYEQTLDRYMSRIEAAAVLDRHWIQAVREELRRRIASSLSRFACVDTVPIDVNLRNYMLDSAGRLWMLNVPLLAYTSTVHGLASFAFQLRAIGGRDELLNTFQSRFGLDYSGRDVACFEALACLGVLSFVAKRAPTTLAEATAWGSNKRLVELATEILVEAGIHLHDPVQ